MMTQGLTPPLQASKSRIGHATIPPPGAATWVAVLVLSTLGFMLPALWNGYPLFFYDSIDYIESSMTFKPEIWRTLPYSLFLAATHFRTSLWLTVIAQSAIAAYLLWEFALAFAPARSMRLMVLAVPLITVGTALPWFASQIMPDAFTGLMVIGLLLLAFARVGRVRLALIGLLTVIAVSAHASHSGTALAAWGMLALLAWLWRCAERPRLIAPLAAAALGIVATPVSHYLATGEFYMSRTAPIMLLARLVRDGEAQAYLREACPQAAYRLCPYVAELTPGWNGANDFLWGWGSPINKIEGWQNWRSFSQEARTIVHEAVKARPVENLLAALNAWAEQLATFGTGSGLGREIWGAAPLLDVLQQRFPQDFAAYTAARQYAGIRLDAVSGLHRIVLGVFMVTALLLAVIYPRRDVVGQVLIVLVAAALANAAVTGIVSNPDDRYQARLVWVFVPAVLAAIMNWPKGRMSADRSVPVRASRLRCL